jgi:acetyl-CoA acyltransferase
VRDVVFVDGVRTPFGKAGAKGIYAETRADDLVVACIRELLRRTRTCPPSASTRSPSPRPRRSATRA